MLLKDSKVFALKGISEYERLSNINAFKTTHFSCFRISPIANFFPFIIFKFGYLISVWTRKLEGFKNSLLDYLFSSSEWIPLSHKYRYSQKSYAFRRIKNHTNCQWFRIFYYLCWLKLILEQHWFLHIETYKTYFTGLTLIHFQSERTKALLESY